MEALHEQRIACPYCGEPMTTLIDPSGGSSEYIEDCQVCCRPIVFHLHVDHDGDISVQVSSEND